jgi:TPR repeat protein
MSTFIVLICFLIFGFLFFYFDQQKSKNEHKARIKTLSTADEEDPNTHYLLGREYWNLKNFALAFTKFKKAALLGHTGALAELGAMYWHGNYVEVDLEKAEELLLAASNSGNVQGQRLLGSLYATGYGNPKDVVFWFTKASLNGDPFAPFLYANFLETTEIIEPNIAMACAWYEVAAAHPINSGCAESARRLKIKLTDAEKIIYELTSKNIKDLGIPVLNT